MNKLFDVRSYRQQSGNLTQTKPGRATNQTNPVAATPTLPTPSGTFGIGRIGYEWIDLSRPDPYSIAPQAHRDLMVYLWYPSPRGNAGEPGWYLPGAKEMDADPDLQPHMSGGI